MSESPRFLNARLLAAAALVALLAAACAPGVGAPGTDRNGELLDSRRAKLAIINAPAGSALRGAADAVVGELQAKTGREYDFPASMALRFSETHMDLFGSRAAAGAARIARDQGADLAIMIGVQPLERRVTSEEGGTMRAVNVRLALEAKLIAPGGATTLATLTTRNYSGSRTESSSEELPSPSEDPTVTALLNRAAAELAATLEDELPRALSALPD